MGSEPEWVPIDHLLSQACSELGVGEMIQCETFSLFEAMSAVEVGNPKMDVTAHVSPSVDGLIASGAASMELSPSQQLAVMERLLLLEASHYCMATPLAASVYTSLYMSMKTDSLQASCPLLAAFCEGLQQTITAVRWIVFNGGVSEEEDFSLMITGLPCEAGVPAGGAAPPDTACLQTLSAAIQTAQRAAKASEDAAVYDAIVTRLTYRRDLHAAFIELQRKTPTSLAACHAHCASVLSALPALATTPISQDELDAAPGFVEALNRHLLGPAPPRTVQVPNSTDAWAAVKRMLQHLQEATHIVDSTGFRDVQLWVARLSAMRAGVVARSAAHYLVAGKAWAAHMPPPPPQPTTGSQGEPQPANGASPSSNGPVSCPWSLDRALLCEALALPVTPSLGAEVDLFLEQAVIAVGNWAQAMLLNACRQRRRLRRGLDDWANLYQHAINADISPSFTDWMAKAGWVWSPGQAGPPNAITGEPDLQGPLATWVANETACCQLLHLQLGWELDLYSPSEYCLLYWYCNHLLNSRRASLQLLLSVQAPAGGKLPQLPPARAKGGKAKAAPPTKVSPATVRRQAGLMADVVCTEPPLHMCIGLVRLLLALQRAGILSEPVLAFNTQREGFDQRFGSFHAPNLVRPQPLSIDQYQDAVRAQGLTAVDLLRLAMQSFEQLRRDCSAIKQQQSLPQPPLVIELMSPEQLAELAVLDKVAATNTLAAMVLIKTLQAQAPAPPTENGEPAKKPAVAVTFDFTQHAVYPTLKVKSVV